MAVSDPVDLVYVVDDLPPRNAKISVARPMNNPCARRVSTAQITDWPFEVLTDDGAERVLPDRRHQSTAPSKKRESHGGIRSGPAGSNVLPGNGNHRCDSESSGSRSKFSVADYSPDSPIANPIERHQGRKAND